MMTCNPDKATLWDKFNDAVTAETRSHFAKEIHALGSDREESILSGYFREILTNGEHSCPSTFSGIAIRYPDEKYDFQVFLFDDEGNFLDESLGIDIDDVSDAFETMLRKYAFEARKAKIASA